MSNLAITWAVAVYLGEKPGPKSTLMLICDRADDEVYEAFPSVRYIANVLEIHERTVIKHLRYLEKIGAIKRTAKWRENGSQASNLYVIDLDWSGLTRPKHRELSEKTLRVLKKDPGAAPSHPGVAPPLESSSDPQRIIAHSRVLRQTRKNQTANRGQVASQPQGPSMCATCRVVRGSFGVGGLWYCREHDPLRVHAEAES